MCLRVSISMSSTSRGQTVVCRTSFKLFSSALSCWASSFSTASRSSTAAIEAVGIGLRGQIGHGVAGLRDQDHLPHGPGPLVVQTVMSGLVLGDQVEQEADVARRLLGEAFVAGQHLGLGRDVLHEALIELLLPHRQADRTIIDVHLTTPPTPASCRDGWTARAEGPRLCLPAPRAHYDDRERPRSGKDLRPCRSPRATGDHRGDDARWCRSPSAGARPSAFGCWPAERLGRVAITVNALPAILPVRFALDHDEIVFRASPGGVLAEATRHAVIAFEADGLGARRRLVERPGHGPGPSSRRATIRVR